MNFTVWLLNILIPLYAMILSVIALVMFFSKPRKKLWWAYYGTAVFLVVSVEVIRQCWDTAVKLAQ